MRKPILVRILFVAAALIALDYVYEFGKHVKETYQYIQTKKP